MAPRIELYDTTLRDGTQMEGISLSVEDKLKVARKLDELGVQYIEGGWPGSNPKDAEFFARARTLALKNATLAAFGSTRRAGGRVGKRWNGMPRTYSAEAAEGPQVVGARTLRRR